MADSRSNPKVDFFFNRAGQWQEEFAELRTIILDCQLTEELKWGVPCYTFGKSNIVLIHGFKEYCAVLFVKGALLQDPEQILIQQTEKVQAARQIRFTGVQEIKALKPVLYAYIHEAVENEKNGLKVEMKETAEYAVPDELQAKFAEVPGLQDAFEALTPGRQRAYLYHFSGPKQSKTRTSRIEKYTQAILDGKGIND